MDIQVAEKALGFDIPRTFASQVTFLKSDNGEMIMLIFRETANARMEDEEGKPVIEIGKNVASVIMPADVGPKLRDILLRNFPIAESKGGKDGKSA